MPVPLSFARNNSSCVLVIYFGILTLSRSWIAFPRNIIWYLVGTFISTWPVKVLTSTTFLLLRFVVAPQYIRICLGFFFLVLSSFLFFSFSDPKIRLDTDPGDFGYPSWNSGNSTFACLFILPLAITDHTSTMDLLWPLLGRRRRWSSHDRRSRLALLRSRICWTGGTFGTPRGSTSRCTGECYWW